MIKVYEKPTCTTCKNLVKLFEERGIDFESVDYQTGGLTEPELRGLLAKAGMNAFDALRMREAAAKELKADGAGEDEIIAAMVETPALLQRPFVVNGERAVMARPIERSLEIL